MIFDAKHEMIRKLVRQFAETELTTEILDKVEETGEFPEEIVEKMAKCGFLGLKIPREYGGAGADTLAYIIMIEEIAAVIRRDHQNILRSHMCLNLRQLLIKISQCLCISVNIPPVSVKHIKINQIDKQQTVKIPVHILKGLFNTIFIAGRIYKLGNAASRKNIVDLADSQNIPSGSLYQIEHGSFWRHQRVIMSSAGSLIVAAPAGKRSCNDTPDTMLSL